MAGPGAVIEKHKKRITQDYTGLTRISSDLTYSGLKEGGHKSPRGLLGAGQDGEGGDQQGQHRVTRHDDRVGRHTARASEPGDRSLIRRNAMRCNQVVRHKHTAHSFSFQSVNISTFN